MPCPVPEAILIHQKTVSGEQRRYVVQDELTRAEVHDGKRLVVGFEAECLM